MLHGRRYTHLSRNLLFPLALLTLLCLPSLALATSDAGANDHGGPVVLVLFEIVIILAAAKLGGDLMVRLRQPEVLGELLIGIVLGNLSLIGIQSFEILRHDQILLVLSELGVILLLFEVGLHTTVADMMKVGTSALLVAVLGVVAPFFLGWGVGLLFVPTAENALHIFLGATLTATSVGITARVLTDLKKITTDEAKIILGAAVIDDVLGLMVLATVSGMITAAEAGVSLDPNVVLRIFGSSLGFLLIAVTLGRKVIPLLFRVVATLRSQGLLLATSLILCFGFAYLAALVGLAPIVGAFTAGLILEPMHYEAFAKKHNGDTIEALIAPLGMLLVPIFFVTMGARVNLLDFARWDLLGFALCLTLAAIVGKQICGLGVLQPRLDRIAIGFGMIPRGEVGLIFASIGASLTLHGQPVIDSATYGAVVLMVIVTTLVTPPLVKWRFSRMETAPHEQP